MDDSIFAKLDQLERGARIETRPPAHAYSTQGAAILGDNEMPVEYDSESMPQAGWDVPEDVYDDQPLTLDSFDERILRQAELDSCREQAPMGRGRLSLAPPPSHSQTSDYPPPMPRANTFGPPVRKLNLSQYALEPEEHMQSTFLQYEQLPPSSPTFHASQRRPAPPPAPAQNVRDVRQIPRESSHEPHRNQEVQAMDRGMPGRSTDQHGKRDVVETFEPSWQAPRPAQASRQTNNGPPVVQGINLVSVHALPDRLRSIFPYPLFNAVQSKCFDTIFRSNNNFVLSSPTGSGKTAVLELAICRLISSFASDTYKIIYQAPTKSLCAERQRDWQAKFAPLGLQCAELTGDTDNAHLRSVQQASIIITTPEKWDSMTRKWKDHQKLMQMVKLFLIDEVHILKEDRGATLEAVVSRMKSVGSDVRFVALSATVPNSEDISAWLGQDPINLHLPASRERFGEDFRPVRLKKHVCGYQSNANDFAFDKTLNAKLPEVIAKYSHRKPIMVFCFTRSSCVETAKLLANWWSNKGPADRYWSAPRKRLVLAEKDLRDTVASGVAFHHAGLTIQDRNIVEKAYLEGEINVICCTSTLAVGVNLPCHMAIVKNTITYQQAGGCKEYSDLEIMQMLGRAGRPQFDDSAVAVIMTRLQRVPYYEKMISGQEILESCLHNNLIDHLNAEIGLGTITSVASAKKWLSGTFLYVRLKQNPDHYKISGDGSARSVDDRIEQFCAKGIALLEEHDLIAATPKLRCTGFGNAMGRYYLQFETMKIIMGLPQHAKVSEILSVVAQAAEFKEIRFRAGEKPVYKDLNKNSSIKFPIPVNLDLPAHKISLIIQSVLGSIELPSQDYKHRTEYNSAKASIFQHATRLIRCIVDCQLYLEDAVTSRNALMLARSIGAHVWDDSPLHMKQLEGLGLVYVRKLASAGIMSIEDLENVEPHRIEQAVSRNPPLGRQMQERARAFPKLRISLKLVGEPEIKKHEYATIRVKAEIGFLNETVPETFQKRPVYVCLLAETSDGHKVHFARISAKKLSKGQEALFAAKLIDASQSVRAYVMCDEIAGTMRHATLKPNIPASVFPVSKADLTGNNKAPAALPTPASTAVKRRTGGGTVRKRKEESDEFADPDLDDDDFAMAETAGFIDIDRFDDEMKAAPKSKRRKTQERIGEKNHEPQQLGNGKWVCNHRCSDKTSCRHMCCRDGLDKKPKPPKAKESKKEAKESDSDPRQTQLDMSVSKKKDSSTRVKQSTEEEPLRTKATTKTQSRGSDSKEARELDRLHNSVKTKTPNVSILGSSRVSDDGNAKQPRLGFVKTTAANAENESNYSMDDDFGTDELPDFDALGGTQQAGHMTPTPQSHEAREAEDDIYGGWDMDLATRDDDPFDVLGADAGDGYVDLSSFPDHVAGADEAEQQAFERHERTDEAKDQDTAAVHQPGKDEHLFIGYTSNPTDQMVDEASEPFSQPQPLTIAADLLATQAVTSRRAAAVPEPLTDKEKELEDWFFSIFSRDSFNIVPNMDIE